MKIRIGLFCVVGGLFLTLPALAQKHFGWFWLSGILTAAVLAVVVRFGPKGIWKQFGLLFLLLEVIGTICTLSEGIIFYREIRSQIPLALAAATISNLFAAAALAGLAKFLNLNSPRLQTVRHRPLGPAAALVLASGAFYVVYYLIFGAIAFQFFTHQYYPRAAEDVAALGQWFWAYQFGRGLLMTLAVLPLIYSLRVGRWQSAVITGLVIWIVGGGAPLLVPNPMMVAAQRYIHIVEIMTQNVSLGLTAVFLLRPGVPRVKEAPKTAPVA